MAWKTLGRFDFPPRLCRPAMQSERQCDERHDQGRATKKIAAPALKKNPGIGAPPGSGRCTRHPGARVRRARALSHQRGRALYR